MDRRQKSVEESVTELTDQMFSFCQKTRRQRINQRNRTERLSDLLDWKSLGLEYAKARQLALRRAYPDSFDDETEFGFGEGGQRGMMSAPGSPRFLSGMKTPGDFATLTEVRLAPHSCLTGTHAERRKCSLSARRTTWAPKRGSR